MELEKLIADMREQGANDEQILEALKKMADEGKITPEDFEKAKEILMGDKEGFAKKDAEDGEADAEKEKAEASRLFGMKLI